ncbi:replication-associated protein [Crucivirus-429]|nr:replication-associated protein [Crucivirus-429]
MSKRNRAVCCCFTLNNYTPAEVKAIRGDTTHYKWLCYGEEVGESGTPHLQGAFSVNGSSSIAYATLHTYPGMARASFRKSIGTFQQNIDYCFKGDLSHDAYMTGGKRQHPDWGRNAVTFFSGKAPEPGKSHKLREAANLIISGAKVEELARTEEFASTVVQYNRGLLYVEACNVPPRLRPPAIFWLYGKTGFGKTRCSMRFATRDGSFWKSGGNSTIGSNLRWFDGYNGQRVAICDDFRGKGLRFDFLLNLLDRYAFRVEFKSGSVPWVPHVIFITTPKSIEDTFEERNKHRPEDITQLTRRVHERGLVLQFGPALGQHNWRSGLKAIRAQIAKNALVVESDSSDSEDGPPAPVPYDSDIEGPPEDEAPEEPLVVEEEEEEEKSGEYYHTVNRSWDEFDFY